MSSRLGRRRLKAQIEASAKRTVKAEATASLLANRVNEVNSENRDLILECKALRIANKKLVELQKGMDWLRLSCQETPMQYRDLFSLTIAIAWHETFLHRHQQGRDPWVDVRQRIRMVSEQIKYQVEDFLTDKMAKGNGLALAR